MAIIRINSTDSDEAKEALLLCQKVFEERGYSICEVNRRAILKPTEEYETSMLFDGRRKIKDATI